MMTNIFVNALIILVKSVIINEKERGVTRMRQFDYSKLKDNLWDTEIVNYLSQIHEQKGKQALYLRQKPGQLDHQYTQPRNKAHRST